MWWCLSTTSSVCRRAGCLSTSSSKDVRGVTPPPVVWTGTPPPAVRTRRVSFHHKQYGRDSVNGVLLSTSVQFFQMHPVSPSPESKRMQMPELVRYRSKRSGPRPLLVCFGTGLRHRLLECRWHQPWCRCPGMQAKDIPYYWQVLDSSFYRALAFNTKLCLKYCNQFIK